MGRTRTQRRTWCPPQRTPCRQRLVATEFGIGFPRRRQHTCWSSKRGWSAGPARFAGTEHGLTEDPRFVRQSNGQLPRWRWLAENSVLSAPGLPAMMPSPCHPSGSTKTDSVPRHDRARARAAAASIRSAGIVTRRSAKSAGRYIAWLATSNGAAMGRSSFPCRMLTGGGG